MKLQIDTKEKTIKVEDNVRLGDLCDTLERLLPEGIWHDYTLEANTVINNWTNPIIIKEIVPYAPTPIWYEWKDTTPPYHPTVTFSDSTMALNEGTFNIQC